MFGFLIRFFRSQEFMDRLAMEMGVDSRIYKTALTEVGVNFASFEKSFLITKRNFSSEQDCLIDFARSSISLAKDGAIKLQSRFPGEHSIDDFLEALSLYDARFMHSDVEARSGEGE